MLKQQGRRTLSTYSLITVQDNTMLKLYLLPALIVASLITVQDNTMLKPPYWLSRRSSGLITVQDNTMLKPLFMSMIFTHMFNYRSG